jgi:hypothetical protein
MPLHISYNPPLLNCFTLARPPTVIFTIKKPLCNIWTFDPEAFFCCLVTARLRAGKGLLGGGAGKEKKVLAKERGKL